MECIAEGHHGIQEPTIEDSGIIIVTEISETAAALRAIIRPPLASGEATTVTSFRLSNNGRWFLTPIGIDQNRRHREFCSRRISLDPSGVIIGVEGEKPYDEDLLTILNESSEVREFFESNTKTFFELPQRVQ